MASTNTYPKLDKLRGRALIAAAAGLILFVVWGLISGTEQLFQSYLYAFLFWNGLGLGCLSALMLHHLVEGRWGFMIQRILEAGARTLPFMFLLVLPIIFLGMKTLYPWVPGGELADSHIVHEKTFYLTVPFFQARMFVYFAIWCGLALVLSRLSHAMDRSGDPALCLRMRWISAPGLVLYVLTMTFYATDLGMSLEPEWFSTIYGPIFIAGQGLACLAFSVIILAKVADEKPHSEVMSIDYFHHIGSLMCGFVVIWSYFSFSQFLITWSGNISEEVAWYVNRTSPGLNLVAIILMLFHFGLPLVILLQRRVKRVTNRLLFMCAWILLARMVDIYWLICPSFHPQQFRLPLTDIFAMVGFGGLWVSLFLWQLKKHPLLPVNDQRMEAALGLDAPAHGAVEHV